MTTLLVLALFKWLEHLISGHPATYAVVAGVSALDAFFPLVPSETIVITASTLAATGPLGIGFIIPAAAVGAFVGDNISYAIGNKVGEPAARRLFRSDKNRQRLEWAEDQIERHGVLLVLAARFIPGGRTATTFAAGMLSMPWKRRFIPADAVAATIWATYASLLGYIGGSTFKNHIWKALLVAFGIAAAIALLIEVGRRLYRRRHSAESSA